ncbi:MAG: hypothetical protein QXE05_09515 [Nitrososphaeria archaeon]
MTLCGSCVAVEYPYECIFWDSYISGKPCPLLNTPYQKYCPSCNTEFVEKTMEEYEEKANLLIETTRLTNIVESLPSTFIPEVRPTDSERIKCMKVIKEIGHPIIAVSISKFFDGSNETSLFRKASGQGLHGLYHFDGKILLTTDVQNELCNLFLRKTDYFVKVIRSLSPDYVTTPDTYTYYNLPAAISRLKIAQTLLTLPAWNETECPVIGLVLGSNLMQIHHYALTLLKLGIRLFAYPCYEMRLLRMDKLIRIRINHLRQRLKCKVLVLSCGPGSGRRFVDADYYSTLSWSISSNPKRSLCRLIALSERRATQRCLMINGCWKS